MSRRFLSTLSLRRATSQQPRGTTRTTYFYPRSPCGERRFSFYANYRHLTFLSTLSLRRATNMKMRVICSRINFYPRSPCGERRWLRCWQLAARDISIHALLAESDSRTRQSWRKPHISIHALLAESDQYFFRNFLAIFEFLSTLSLRRATNSCTQALPEKSISIHALLAESDYLATW